MAEFGKMLPVTNLVSHLLLLTLSTQALFVSNGLQRFEKQPEYTEVNPGEDVKLTCVIFNKRGSCSWQKNNKPVGIYKDKYEWAASEDSGDCSLLIKHVTIDFDDGEWECQVTASEFTAQDALTSTPVRLVVRVAPQWPKIEVNNTQVLPGHNISSDVGKTITVKCVSRYGNPPARLKWFLGDKELLMGSNQTNAPEMDNNRTYVATSLLDIVYTKDSYGRTLRCVALHKSYPKESQEVSVRLDVKYAPEVRLEGVPTGDLEEGKDNVVLRCAVDSNPPSTVRWKLGEERIVSAIDTLQFRPVKRRDSGSYYCEAENSVGTSVPLSVNIDVKYPPRIKKVGPTRLTTAPLYSEATFSCEAEGNPPPTYQWLQKVPGSGDTLFTRGSEPKLRIANISYEHQGEYTCRVSNIIGESERTAESEAIVIQVVGAPQVLRHAGTREVLAVRGEEAVLRLIVCADPRPKKAFWEWGSEFVEAGKPNGRYNAELSQDEREDCYQARLHVQDVEPSDTRNYFLHVENERGVDKHLVHLTVKEPIWTTTFLSIMHHEPVPMTTLLSIAAGCLLIFLLCVFLAIYVVRREKCCFGRRGDFRPTDLESEKSDLNSELGRKQPPSVIVGTGPGTVPAETMYNSSPGRRTQTITAQNGGSPEAMKHREGSSWRKQRKEPTLIANQHRKSASTFLPLDYHNLNKLQQEKEKTDVKVGRSRCRYKPETDDEKDSNLAETMSERYLGNGRSFSRAVSSFKNSNFHKTGNWSNDEIQSCIVRKGEESENYLENPQRTLEHSITRTSFNDKSKSYYANQGASFSNANAYVKTKAVPYVDTGDSDKKFKRFDDFRYEGSYYTTNRRVAPIYMANPYQPESIDRAEI